MSTASEKRAIEIVVNGVQAGQSIKELGKDVRTLQAYVNGLKPGTEEFVKGTQRLSEAKAQFTALKAEINGVGNAMGHAKAEASASSSIFNNILGAGAVLGAISSLGHAIKGFVTESISAFKEAEQASARLEQAIRSTGGGAGWSAGELKKQAVALQDVTTYDDDAIIGAQALLVTFTKIGKETFPQATKATLDISAALGTDLHSSAIMVGKALNDPTQGLMSLRRAGVSFTQQQVEQIKALQQSGHLYEAQALVIKEINTEFGGMAEAIANTDTGKMEQMAVKWGNLKEHVGDFATSLLGSLAPAINKTMDLLGKMADEFGLMARGGKFFQAYKDSYEIWAGQIENTTDKLLKSAKFTPKQIIESFQKDIERLNKMKDQATPLDISKALNAQSHEHLTNDEILGQVDALQEAIQKLTVTEGENRKKAADDAAAKADAIAKANDKIKADTLKLLGDLDLARIQNIKDDEQREITDANFKAQQRIKEIEKTKADAGTKAALIKEINTKLQDDITGIEKKYQDKRSEQEFQDSQKFLAASQQQRREALAKMYADGLIDEGTYNSSLRNMETQFLHEKLTLYQDYGKDVTDINKQISDNAIKNNENDAESLKKSLQAAIDFRLKYSIQGSFAQLQAQKDSLDKQMNQELANTDLTETQKKAIRDYYRGLEDQAEDEFIAGQIQKWSGMISDFASSYLQIQKNKDDKELLQEQKTHDKKKKLLDQQLKEGKISQQQYDEDVQKSDAALAKKQADIKYKEAVQQRDLKVFEILTNTAANIVKVFPNPILMAAAGTIGGAQILAVTSAPLPDTEGFAEGGYTAVSDGGFVGQKKMAWFGEKGREWVAPNWMVQSPQYVNTIAFLEAARQRGYADGGFTQSATPAPQFSNPSVGATDPMMSNTMKEIVIALGKLNDKLSQPIQAQGVWDWQVFKKDFDRLNNIEDSGIVS